MQRRDISVGLEKIHGVGVTGKPEAAKQLSDDVEGDFYVCDGLDDATRDAEEDGEEDTIQGGGGGGVGRVNRDDSSTNTDGDTQHDKVDPVGNLLVRPH